MAYLHRLPQAGVAYQFSRLGLYQMDFRGEVQLGNARVSEFRFHCIPKQHFQPT
jgi:hypothetical protein